MMIRPYIRRGLWKPEQHIFFWDRQVHAKGHKVFLSDFQKRQGIVPIPGTPRKGSVWQITRKGNRKPFQHPWHDYRFMAQIPF